MQSNNTSVATSIVALRQENGLTQQELAPKAGVSLDELREIESGQKRQDRNALDMIAYAFNMTLSELLNYTPKTPTVLKSA